MEFWENLRMLANFRGIRSFGDVLLRFLTLGRWFARAAGTIVSAMTAACSGLKDFRKRAAEAETFYLTRPLRRCYIF
ncbi:hypothetical protein [Caballeronia sp. LZ034LL]|uniref:hypothetical protein n=1 Tax=Caballeronia sp. LZ034LL TaxID=3038567 RepID=UPI0028624ADD|nr:hypothetical protein [Caballeronia sp. LZ034LL]MDR5834335.1 hypothetical protein [Caballeronia sp. LZ034LL]